MHTDVVFTATRRAQIMRTSGAETFPADPAFQSKVERLADVLGDEGAARKALLFLAENPDALLATDPQLIAVKAPKPAPYPHVR